MYSKTTLTLRSELRVHSAGGKTKECALLDQLELPRVTFLIGVAAISSGPGKNESQTRQAALVSLRISFALARNRRGQTMSCVCGRPLGSDQPPVVESA